MKRTILALLAVALIAPAAAQVPTTLPANTVVGRLGVASGPAQAIPFGVLTSNLLSGIATGQGATTTGGVLLVQPGKARMWPKVVQTVTPTDAYQAVDPFGNAISCAATTTQCLQEFFNVTTANGWPAEVDCRGTLFPGATEPVLINVSSPVTVNVNQDWSFEARGCNLNGALVTSSLLTINSSGSGRFVWDGKIVYTVTSPVSTPGATLSCAVMINPTTNTGDGFPGLYAGYTWIRSVVSTGSGGTAGGGVCLNTATGSTIQHELKFGEINGTNSTAYGIIEFSPSATTGLLDNIITVAQVHGTTVAAVQDGTAATNQGNLRNNIWVIGSIEVFSGIAIETYGSYNKFTVGAIDGSQGTMATGLSIKAGAVRANFDYGTIGAATTAQITDGGTCSTWQGAQGSQIAVEGTTSGCTKVVPAAVASGTVTFPAATDTLTGKATTDILTNKTYDTAGTGNVFKLAGTTVGTVAQMQAAIGYPVILGGTAATVNLNSATTDTAITITGPTTNYMVDRIVVVNNGSTASLTTATAGLFTATGGGGLALAANQALSPITANAIGTDANSFALVTTIGSRTAISAATLQFRVGSAQGAAATGNVYVWIRPLP